MSINLCQYDTIYKNSPQRCFSPQNCQDWGGAGRVPCAFLKRPQLFSSSVTDVQKIVNNLNVGVDRCTISTTHNFGGQGALKKSIMSRSVYRLLL